MTNQIASKASLFIRQGIESMKYLGEEDSPLAKNRRLWAILSGLTTIIEVGELELASKLQREIVDAVFPIDD